MGRGNMENFIHLRWAFKDMLRLKKSISGWIKHEQIKKKKAEVELQCLKWVNKKSDWIREFVYSA